MGHAMGTVFWRPRSRPLRPAGRVSLLGWLLAADARHRQLRSLERLDARLLRDIGLTSGDVAREIRRRARD